VHNKLHLYCIYRCINFQSNQTDLQHDYPVHLYRSCDALAARPILASQLGSTPPVRTAHHLLNQRAQPRGPPSPQQNPHRPSENKPAPNLLLLCRPPSPNPLSFSASPQTGRPRAPLPSSSGKLPPTAFLLRFRCWSLGLLVFCWFGSLNPWSLLLVPRENGFSLVRLLDRFRRFPPIWFPPLKSLGSILWPVIDPRHSNECGFGCCRSNSFSLVLRPVPLLVCWFIIPGPYGSCQRL
jgi:hypothetical protein